MPKDNYGKRKIMGVLPPCIGRCTTTAIGDLICSGCGRTDQEVLKWNNSPLGKKIEVIERLDREGLLNERNRPRYPWLDNSN